VFSVTCTHFSRESETKLTADLGPALSGLVFSVYPVVYTSYST